MRVLVVDDSETIRPLIAAMLQNAGYEVLMASNGLEALDMLREGGHAEPVVEVGTRPPVPCPRELVVLEGDADRGLAEAGEVTRPVLLVPGQAEGIEVPSSLVGGDE